MSTQQALRDVLTAIDGRLRELASDLSGLGLLDDDRVPLPPLDDLQRLTAIELEVVKQSLDELAAKATLVRNRHLARELAGLDLDRADLKISLTGGAPEGWISLGFSPAKVRANLLWPLPFRDGSAAFVYFALALEHLYYPVHALGVLREVRRVLRPGGVLRVVVPDLGKYIHAYVARNERFFLRHRELWPWAAHANTPLDILLTMAGSGMDRGPGDFWSHKAGYDFPTIQWLATRAGFSSVIRSEYDASVHPELRIDGISHDASYGDENENFNLFVEAT